MPLPPSRLQGLSPAAIQQVIACATALEAGRPDEADRHLAGILATHPNQPELLRLRAGILNLRGNHTGALEVMRSALAQRPDDALYCNTMGSILGDAGEFDGAISVLKRACALQPGLAVAWFNLGVMLTRCVRHREAVDALRRTVDIDPQHHYARCLLADMLRVEGRLAQAQAEYRSVLKSQPWFGMAWWGLADIKTIPFTPQDIQAMHAAASDSRATIDDRIACGFALAKALHDAEDYPRSLSILAQAHAIARRRQQWDRKAFSAIVDSTLAGFTPDPAFSKGPQLGSEVIFITGLPRSGSTLVEQILASHSLVQGAGELPDLPLVLNEESRRRGKPFPLWAAEMEAGDWKRLGERYLERTAYWRTEKPCSADKLPVNWLYIGAIRAMLPGSHILLCRRDPLETCFSCYRQFMQQNEYTRTFEDLAVYYRDFDRSARTWQSRYEQHVLTFVHEELLAAPDAYIGKLLAFCDLPFEEACIRFHATQRNVHSPSATQVRQPLLRDTTHTRGYGALLDPLRLALGMPPFQSQ